MQYMSRRYDVQTLTLLTWLWSRQYPHLYCLAIGAMRYFIQTPPDITMCGTCPLSRRDHYIIFDISEDKSEKIMF